MSVGPHPIDHLVLSVSEIAAARARLTRLGFSVAPDARHPFGTENACVFFADKTYLEPLGIADEKLSALSAREGNQFTARNNAFRFRNGPEGLSAVVFGTENADGDHARFRELGISAGDQLIFSRTMSFPGNPDIVATFKLSFAADLRSPDFFAFTCQRLNMPPTDRSALERHDNGTIGISGVILGESDPMAFEDFIKAIVGGPALTWNDHGLTSYAANGEIEVRNAVALKDRFGIELAAGRGLTGQAVVFKVRSLVETEKFFNSANVAFVRSRNLLLVAHEVGQGSLFAFGE